MCLLMLGPLQLLVLPAVAAEGALGTQQKTMPPVYNAYTHLGVGGDIFIMKSSDIGELLDPFDPSAVGFGYSYFARVGLRNIVQFEYRGGRDKNSLVQSYWGLDFKEHFTYIDMRNKYSEFVVKVNPVFYAYQSKDIAIFFLWGKGDIEYVDDNGDGFWDGEETVYGFEVSRVLRNVSAGASVEIHDATFQRFGLEQFGYFEGSFDAREIRIGINVGVGLGF